MQRLRRLKAAQWLTDTFHLTVEDARAAYNDALRGACWQGHLGIVQWLVNTFRLTAEDLDNCALRWGDREAARWLKTRFLIGYQ